MVKLSAFRRAVGSYLSEPVVRFLARTPVTPGMLTWFGFLLAVGAAVLIVTGHFLAAGLVVLFGGFFDMLDGALARRTGSTTQFGAVLDSTLDRLSEAVLLFGVLVVYASEQMIAPVLLVFAVLLLSQLVSYIRARLEALGMQCPVGLFTRPERVVVLALGLLLSRVEVALAVIAVFSFVTIGQRLIYGWQQAKRRG